MAKVIFDLAERKVREGEAHVEEQRHLIALLERNGHYRAADVIRRRLTPFEATLARKRAHLERTRWMSTPAQSHT
jgi:hypothetical protein